MGFGTIAIISLVYAVVGVRVVSQIIQRRREVFDLTVTPEDRRMITEAAFFILLPISVALHELGHAVAVWGFGGEVVDFGFYVFSGYVSHRGFYTEDQRILISVAGSAVNVLLTAAAIATVLLRRPPMRAAFNELLLQFGVLSTLNALVFYPLLDFAVGLNGDWSQIYLEGMPPLSVMILVGHVGILALAFWASRNASVRRRLAVLTGLPSGAERGLLGELAPSAARAGRRTSAPRAVSPAALVLQETGQRVADGWPHPVQGTIHERDGLVVASLGWLSQDTRRTVVTRILPTGSTELWGILQPNDQPGGEPTARRQLQTWPALPEVDALTMSTRLAMEEVERW